MVSINSVSTNQLSSQKSHAQIRKNFFRVVVEDNDCLVHVLPFLTVEDNVVLNNAMTNHQLRDQLIKSYVGTHIPAFDDYRFTGAYRFGGIRWVIKHGICTLKCMLKMDHISGHEYNKNQILWELADVKEEAIGLYYAERMETNSIVSQQDQTDPPCSTLWRACRRGHANLVSLLLDRGAEEDIGKVGIVEEGREYSALEVAALRGHLEVVRVLFNGGATASQKSLEVAADNGHLEVVNFLIDRGATVNNESDQSALFLALRSQHHEVVRVLLARGGADVKENDQHVCLLHAAVGCGEEIVMLLLERGAHPDRREVCRNNPLHRAAKLGNTKVCSLLVEAGAGVNLADEHFNLGSSPLHVALRHRHLETARELIDLGADINQVNSNGMTPLYRAVAKGRRETVIFLAENGADVNKAVSKTAEDGFSPLYAATLCYDGNKNFHDGTFTGNIEMVLLLLSLGADCHAADKCGVTPLHVAANNGRIDIVEALSKATLGADVKQPSAKRETPFFACRGGNLEVVRALRAGGGSDMNCIHGKDEGWTALHSASSRGQQEVVKILLEEGADFHAVDKDNHTPLDVARDKIMRQVLLQGLRARAPRLEIRK